MLSDESRRWKYHMDRRTITRRRTVVWSCSGITTQYYRGVVDRATIRLVEHRPSEIDPDDSAEQVDERKNADEQSD